jgi:hypothetical protein
MNETQAGERRRLEQNLHFYELMPFVWYKKFLYTAHPLHRNSLNISKKMKK